MRIVSLIIIAVTTQLIIATTALAQIDCPPGETPWYHDGSGIYGMVDLGLEKGWYCGDPGSGGIGFPLPAVPGTVTPSDRVDDFDPFDFSGIYLEVSEPEKLQATSLDSGKAYLLAPHGKGGIDVYGVPAGQSIGFIDSTSGEVRAKYYYVEDVQKVWAGICARSGVCGWVHADDLLSVPPQTQNYSVYSVVAPEIFAFEQPDVYSTKLGSIFENNLVAVIEQVQNDTGYWSYACRLEACGWVASENLMYEY